MTNKYISGFESIVNSDDFSKILKSNSMPDKLKLFSLASNFSYNRLSKYDKVGVNDRATIIPCNLYEEIIVSGSSGFDVDKFQAHHIEKRSVVATIIRREDIFLISFRGTEKIFRDLWFDATSVAPKKVSVNKGQKIKFAIGFYNAAMECIYDVLEYVHNNRTSSKISDVKIHITGHSLGGAIAAIFNILVTNGYIGNIYFGGFAKNIIESCFVFGMPKYGDTRLASWAVQPVSLIINADPVPNHFSFLDCQISREYYYDILGNELIGGRNEYKKFRGNTEFSAFINFTHHRCESYCKIFSKAGGSK